MATRPKKRPDSNNNTLILLKTYKYKIFYKKPLTFIISNIIYIIAYQRQKEQNMQTEINWHDTRFRNEILAYKYLIENFETSDVTDKDCRDSFGRNFQRTCNDYFHNGRVAQALGAPTLLEHYKLLEMYKKSPNRPDFKKALLDLYTQTGKTSVFLASQVAHFFNPDMPICSRFVLNGLNTTVTNTDISTACDDYEHLVKLVHEFRDSNIGQEIIRSFRESFNERINRNISDTKIIDFYFWFMALDKGE